MTANEALDRVTDEIVALFDGFGSHEWSVGAARIHVRRILRDAFPELWEESAAEGEVERLQAEVATATPRVFRSEFIKGLKEYAWWRGQTIMRTSKQQWFLDIARRCAEQGTCLIRNYGAVIVDINNTIVSTGYTGAPVGEEECSDTCWRKLHNILPGSNYDKCRSVHAEMNAIIQAGKNAIGGTIYISGLDRNTEQTVWSMPCFLCAKMIINARIQKIIIQQMTDYIEYEPQEVYRIRLKEATNDD